MNLDLIFLYQKTTLTLLTLSGNTNYDYETLVHEIGHALGLKHPFEADRNNSSILNEYEDQTIHGYVV